VTAPAIVLRTLSHAELVMLVAQRDASALEIELAGRLEQALERIDDLEDDVEVLRAELAELQGDHGELLSEAS
jgi:hypothetical protein